ncbi:MAG: toll/interleukin-1 receptor domain-containing protein [Promethearchaeota archaeon]|nr:MAG: toll/interleukin-1 receptor domain-containing protein [Candidatus Lokiarchaeota archaeon]
MDLKIFISYATTDKNLYQIKEIADFFKQKPEISNVWYWEESAYGKIYKFMNEKINECDVVLLFCSENSLTSEFVEDEWIAARSQGKIVIPIFNQLSNVPVILRGIRGFKFDFENFSDSLEKIFELILKSVKDKREKLEQKYDTLLNQAKKRVKNGKWENAVDSYRALLNLCNRYNWEERNDYIFKKLNLAVIERELEKIREKNADNYEKIIEDIRTSDLLNEIPISEDRANFLENLKDNISKDQESQIFPISGNSGIGKTFLIQKFVEKFSKNQLLDDFKLIKINQLNLLEEPEKFYYKLYLQIIDKLGFDFIDNLITKRTIEWGAESLVFGFYRTADIDMVKNNGYNKYKLETDNLNELKDIINTMVTYIMDPYKKNDAKNYLHGKEMEVRELANLNLIHNLTKEEYGKEILRILFSKSKLILIFEDLDKIEKIETFYNKMEDLFEILQYLKVILSFNINKANILDFIPEDLKNITHNLYQIQKFDLEYTYQFFSKLVSMCVKKHNFTPSKEIRFFPFSEGLIESIFNIAKGNPREIIKQINNLPGILSKEK